MIPLELVAQVVRLINNLIEGDATRTAQSVAWFWLLWPTFKGRFTLEQQTQIESLVKQIVVPAAPSVVIKGDKSNA